MAFLLLAHLSVKEYKGTHDFFLSVLAQHHDGGRLVERHVHSGIRLIVGEDDVDNVDNVNNDEDGEKFDVDVMS